MNKFVCQQCGKVFYRAANNRRFCSCSCTCKYRHSLPNPTIGVHGRRAWNRGLKGSEAWNKNHKMPEDFCKKISAANIRRFKKPEERLKISITHNSEAHKRGYKKQAETLRKRYASGEIQVWNKGLTKETHPQLAQSNETRIKKREKSRRLWNDPEYRHKVIRRSLKALFGNRPTSLEKKFIELIGKYDLPFEYVGDGKLIISSCCPDFVATNGKKLLVEVANKVPHHHHKNYALQRYAIFAKFGYRTCTIWSSSFKGNDWEHNVLKILTERGFIDSSIVAVCRAALRRK